MGISLDIVDMDAAFHTEGKHRKIIINDFSERSEADKDSFNRLIYTKDTTGLLSNIASCECGKVTGEFHRDVVCEVCHQPVDSSIEQKLESFVWIKTPEGVSKLMNPKVWTILNDRFTKSGFEILRWICDTHYQPPVKIPPIMESVQALGIERGYNNFVRDFDAIMAGLFGLKGLKVGTTKGTKLKRGQEDPCYTFVKKFRDRIFCDYLPLPNRALLVVEQTNVGTYVDPVITGAIDAIQMMAGIDDPMANHSVRVKENRTIRAIAQLGICYDGIDRTILAKKEGLFRKHVFGTRSHFCFRAVISSLTNVHRYDEIHIPWGVGVSTLKTHLTSKLINNHNYAPNEAKEFLNAYALTYHPFINDLFLELIAESPYGGIPCIFQRNPSLERGSAQAMYITKVKTDPDDPTVSLSILSVVGFNADFDGDQLNGTLSVDNLVTDQLMNLAPHKSVFDLTAPRNVSRNLSMPKPTVSTVANWIHSADAKAVDPVKRAKMEKMFLQ